MHTHADAVVALTNTPDGHDIVRDYRHTRSKIGRRPKD